MGWVMNQVKRLFDCRSADVLAVGFIGLLTSNLCLFIPSVSAAQPTNGTVTLVHDTLTTAGGPLGGSTPVSAVTLMGHPTGGMSSNALFTLIGGDQDVPIGPGGASLLVNVTGTTNDPSSVISVSANGATGIPATISGSLFAATSVRLFVGPNTVTATATDPYGNTATVSITVYVDLPAEAKTPSVALDVIGTIDDPTASVTVNGIAATVANGQFTAKAVPLSQGFNVLTATATDIGGNTATQTIGVFIDTTPPARPTVGTLGPPVPEVTTATSLMLSGTKTRGTSIWINGQPAVLINDETIWMTNVTLVEGDNEFRIIAKDIAGNTSAENLVNVIVDTLPPVVTVTVPTKTNLNPLTITGTVDDSKTTVTIKGITATRTTRSFSVAVPLVEGPNSLLLIATSPNGYVTTKTLPITLGTIPTIVAIQPGDGAKLYTGITATLSATATDKENDPLEYQVLLDGQILRDWATASSTSWAPTVTQRGLHTLEVRVRDSFGGYASKQAQVFVGRAHVKPLSP